MNLPRRLALLILVACSAARPLAAAEYRFGPQTLTVPDGYLVEEAATPSLVARPITMDFDERGRLYVSESSGSNEKVETQLAEKPHRILRLVDMDGDGVFDTRSVFADRMMLPEGTLWFRGSLYVSAPPVIWKLTDTNDDGVADRREKWFDGKTLTGCANDLHGPYLGRDGWIYWCKGAFDEQTHDIPGHPGWKTRASHLFRARPDGSGMEPVLTGGMDNPVDIVFTPEGERILSCTFLQHPGGGKRDGLIHAIYGGVYGKDHGVLDGHPRTGGLMPPMTHLGPAAPCGLHYRETDGALYAANFNLRKITRHGLRWESSMLATEDSDFLVSDSTDFHPTDVIEDADGSLLVCDTGGWYKLCCPTSQIAKPEVAGALYRIRKIDAPKGGDPRGLAHTLASAEPTELIAFLGDPRPVLRERAMQGLVATGRGAVPSLDLVLRWGESKVERLHALWTLCRMPEEAARESARLGLSDDDATIRHAACHVAGLWRDAGAFADLARIVKEDTPPIRRAAAEALGRLGAKETGATLFAALREDDDRTLFHAITYAALESGDLAAARAAMENGNAAAKAAALYVLEQTPDGGLTPRDVGAHLGSPDSRLAEAALWVARQHSDWGKTLAPLLWPRVEAGGIAPTPDLAAILTASDETRSLIARGLREGQAASLALAAVSGERPDEWIVALLALLDSAPASALPVLGNLPAEHPLRAKVDEALLRHADSEHGLPALQAMTKLPEPLPESVFAYLVAQVSESGETLRRAAAAEILARAKLEDARLESLASLVPKLGAMEINALLPLFAKASSETRDSLWAALSQAPSLTSVRPDLLAAIPDETGKSAAVLARLDKDREARSARLDKLAQGMIDADARRGHQVFHSAKAGCSACHALGYVGGEFGPDLSRIGSVRTERDLLEAIVYPSASFVRSYEPVIVTRTDGSTMLGILREQDADGVTLAPAPGATLHVRTEEVRSVEPAPVSLMPPGLDQILGARELTDLVRFLKERQ